MNGKSCSIVAVLLATVSVNAQLPKLINHQRSLPDKKDLLTGEKTIILSLFTNTEGVWIPIRSHKQFRGNPPNGPNN